LEAFLARLQRASYFAVTAAEKRRRPGTATWTAAGVVDVPGRTISVSSDQTNEGLLSVNASWDDGYDPFLGLIGYEGPLSGVDSSGGLSTFSASFGFFGLTDSATVFYSAGLTPAGLASEMYSQLLAGLPSSLQPDLSLSGDEIAFSFPLGQSAYFVQSTSTDTGVGLTGGTATAPEPSSLALLGSGFLGVGGLLRKRWLARS
jgi:hypothetical protein